VYTALESIPTFAASSNQCSFNNNVLFSKYCGVALNPFGGAITINIPVCCELIMRKFKKII
jgi:hypothetical protein